MVGERARGATAHALSHQPSLSPNTGQGQARPGRAPHGPHAWERGEARSGAGRLSLPMPAPTTRVLILRAASLPLQCAHEAEAEAEAEAELASVRSGMSGLLARHHGLVGVVLYQYQCTARRRCFTCGPDVRTPPGRSWVSLAPCSWTWSAPWSGPPWARGSKLCHLTDRNCCIGIHRVYLVTNWAWSQATMVQPYCDNQASFERPNRPFEWS